MVGPGNDPTMHRCPRCLHPVAPGPGVPRERFGAFTEGSGADCNECGTALAPGTRMLAGGSGRSDDPNRSLRSRWITGVVAGAPLALGALGFGWIAVRLFQRGGDSAAAVVGSLLLLAVAALCAWGLHRVAVVPLMAAARGERIVGRSTWLVHRGGLEQWRSNPSGPPERRAAGTLLCVSVRARTRAAGTPDESLVVTVHAAGSGSLEALGASPGQLAATIGHLQQFEPAFIGPAGRGLWLPGSMARLPTAVPAPTLRMRLSTGEPGLENAATAVRTIALACLGADGTACGAEAAALEGTRDPRRGRGMRRLAHACLPVAAWAAALGSVACLVGGGIMLLDSGGAPAFTIMFFGPMACGFAAALCAAGRTPAGGPDANSAWHASAEGLIVVDADPGCADAVALGIPAATLAQLGPELAATDAGTGESTVAMRSGTSELKSITMRCPLDEALAAAGAQLHRAMPPGRAMDCRRSATATR